MIKIEDKKNYLYLMKLREFIRLGENTYKIGTTTKSVNKLKYRHPKSSQLLLFVEIENQDMILFTFKQKFVRKREYGYSYYEGDIDNMINVILNVRAHV